MAERTGQQFGNYRLVSLLGQGGFAEVYLGEHIYLDTQAAIKVLHAQIASDEIGLFRAEARTVARLIHPHIVRVLEFGLEGTTPFLVTDYAPNGSLRGRHPRGTRLPLSLVVSYTRQVAEALQYAHEQKVVHRDVKPENMLLGREDQVLLSDFGIALVSQSARYMSTQGFQELAGTIMYMAPEQMRAQALPASDQYSLAVVAYEWLSGERPFTGTFSEIAVKHTLAPPPGLRVKVPELPVEVEKVVFKALAKEPEQRYSSVLVFAQALTEAAGSSADSAILRKKASGRVKTPSRQPLMPPSKAEHSTLPLWRQKGKPVQVQAEAKKTTSLDISARTSASLPALTSESSTGAVTLPVADEVLASLQADGAGKLVHPVVSSPKAGVTRRKVLLGTAFAGAALVGSAGLLTWFVRSHPMPVPLTTDVEDKPALLTYTGHTSYVWSVAWSPDGRALASASDDQTVHVISALQGTLLATPYSRHTDSVYSVAWSHDSKRLASVSADQRLETWDAPDGYYPRDFRASSWIWSVAWSPDGRYLASGGGDRLVTIWDAATGGSTLEYKGHKGNINALAWSPDGRSIASASSDHTTQVWSVAGGKLVRTHVAYPMAVTMRSVAWSPDGKRLAVACDNQTVQVWDAFTGDHHYVYQGHTDLVYSVAWSHDGRYLASAGDDRAVQVWDATNGEELHTFRGHSEGVRSLSWSPDGKYLASGSWDKTVKVWSLS